MWWSGLTVMECWSDGLIWWSGLMMVCCVFGCGGLIWVLIWLSVAVVWRAGFREEGLVWRLKIEKIRSCVKSGKITQLSVRDLRRQKRKKKKVLYFFKFSCNFGARVALNRKGLPKPNQTDSNDHCGSFPFEISILISMSNILVTIETIEWWCELRKYKLVWRQIVAVVAAI